MLTMEATQDLALIDHTSLAHFLTASQSRHTSFLEHPETRQKVTLSIREHFQQLKSKNKEHGPQLFSEQTSLRQMVRCMVELDLDTGLQDEIFEYCTEHAEGTDQNKLDFYIFSTLFDLAVLRQEHSQKSKELFNR